MADDLVAKAAAVSVALLLVLLAVMAVARAFGWWQR